jgi:AraC-like DNA-binding protein
LDGKPLEFIPDLARSGEASLCISFSFLVSVGQLNRYPMTHGHAPFGHLLVILFEGASRRGERQGAWREFLCISAGLFASEGLTGARAAIGRKMKKYGFAGDLPPSELVTLDGLRPYLARAGRDPFEAHLHSFNQILWFRAGEGVHLVDFVEHPYGPQTLLYVPHGAVHAFREDDALDGAILHFDDVMAMGSSDGQSLPGILRLLALGSRHTRTLSSAQALEMESSIEMLALELSAQDDFGKSTAIEAALRLLLVRVCRQFRETTEPRSTEYKRYLDFLGLVESHYAEGLSIEAYATQIGVSSKTLSRSVHDAASCSPKDVISERLTLEMKRLLVHTDLTVKEIAGRLGIHDASYLTRFFRKQAGVAPSAFRASWR